MKKILLIIALTAISQGINAQTSFPLSAAEDTTGVMGKQYWEDWNPKLQKEIDRNIEKYRKADAALKLSDVKSGTKVKVEQLSHDFGFGAHIFNFDQLGSDELNAKYKKSYGELFNAATLAFYWGPFEPIPGSPRYESTAIDEAWYWNEREEPWKEFHWRRPAPGNIIDFCEEQGISMHGHPIVWGRYLTGNLPKWVSKSPDRVGIMETLFMNRVAQIAQYYKDRIPSWDVVNESVDPVAGEPRYGVMPDDYTYKAYKVAEKYFPSNVLLNHNDSWRAVYPPFIKSLINRGAKIDVVGLQMHIFSDKECLEVAQGNTVFPNGTSWKPKDVIGYLNALDSLGRPIHLSEVTIQAPGVDQKSNEIQAIIAQNMYRLWFSWPSIFKITWWNTVDDCGASGEPTKSGIFTRQMEPKAVYYALDNLINHQWKTNIEVDPNKKGEVSFRGFKGKYRVTWTDASDRVHAYEFYLKNDGDGFSR